MYWAKVALALEGLNEERVNRVRASPEIALSGMFTMADKGENHTLNFLKLEAKIIDPACVYISILFNFLLGSNPYHRP